MIRNMKQTILVGVIYGITVVVMALLWFVLPAQITAKLALSFVFLWIPVTVLFGTFVYSCNRDRNENVQNGFLTVMAVLYLVAAALVSLIFGILPVSIRVYVIAQILVLLLGVLAMVIAVMAKKHIESD